MKIVALDTYLLEPRWLFLAVRTDEGIVGWGEPVVEGRAQTVAAAIGELSDYLIGKDASRIEDHWQALTKGGFYRGGPVLSSAISGIDQALWDIKGKALGVPVYELLGGLVRDRVRVYSWIAGDQPKHAVEAALERKELGFTAVKMNASGPLRLLEDRAQIRAIVERVAAVRDAVGDDFDIVVDFHGRMTSAIARQVLVQLEPLHPLFVEEPLVPELDLELKRVCATTTVPIATGERLYSRWDFRTALASGIAVAQPDISHAGGISETRRIAAAAETHGVAIAPHCPLGPLTFASSVQLDLATPNALIQESGVGLHYNGETDQLDYLLDSAPLRAANGFVAPPDKPGLGVEVDENAVRHAAARGHRWRNPTWRRDDGSLAEW